MNGYCRQCSLDLFDEDLEEMAGFIPRSLVAEGYGLVAICDACGPLLVDHDGARAQPQAALDRHAGQGTRYAA